MSNSSIMSVRDMIDSAFGEADVNIVNFKLIQAVLYLLARQLRILERRVGVEIEIHKSHSKTNLSVTEIKIRASVPKKRKRGYKAAGGGTEDDETKHALKTSKSKPLGIQKSTSEKSTQEKSSSDKTTSEKTKSTSDKTSTEKTKSSTDRTSSEKTKTSTDITSSEKTKSSSDKTSSEKTKSSTDRTSSEKTKSSTDKTSSDKTKSSTDKSSADKSSTDKSSADKSSTDKSSIDKSSTDKSSTAKTSTEKSSTEKSSTEKSSTEKSTTEKSSTEKSSTDKSSTNKSSTDKSSTDKSSTDKTTSSSKKSSSAKDTSDKSSSDQQKKKDLPNLLEFVEEQREKELRVIHQRADSREVGDKSPTPMVSLDSVEEQYERLLIVERVPTERKRSSIGKRTPQLSIVTQDQFEALANVVRELQDRFATEGTPDFPDNVQLMQDLRKGASLTDAMAALQLSARLDAAEKTLKQMMELVTDLVPKSDMEIELQSKGVPDDMNVTQKGTGTSTPLPSRSKKSVASKQSKLISKSEMRKSSMPSSETSKIDIVPTPSSVPGPEEDKFVVPLDWITYDELDNAIQEVTNGLLKTVTGLTTQSNVNAENALRTANRLEDKLEASLNMGNRMNELELLVSAFSEQVTVLDTGLSSQMTNYQEQLTQMQHDLESGLEAMAEALANTGGDTVAVAELNTHFTNLQFDMDNANTRQKELMESQNGLSQDLQALWQQIEMLRELKSDRDEVADALRDKAGLGALNGLVSLEQFNAVRGDFEKRIGAAYDKFNNQEIIWQKAIDDLLRELNDKADWDQLLALRNDVNKNLEMLRSRTHAMLEIVGEPRATAVTRKLFRDATCLSCSSPAHMDLEEPSTVPKLAAFPGPLTRPPTIGAEDTSKPTEDGDHRVCFSGYPIPHPIDPRAHICHRYCGGSHTLVMDKKSRAPVGINIIPVSRPVTTGIGSDGKTYMVEETLHAKEPCLPCNEMKLNTPQPSETEPATEKREFDPDMTPSDFMSALCSIDEPKDGSATPPPPTEDF